jgi:hypothetical protein
MQQVAKAIDGGSDVVLPQAIQWKVNEHDPASVVKRQVAKVRPSNMRDEGELVWLHAKRGSHGI